MVWPFVKFRLDESGRVPHGKTVTKPPKSPASPSTTVTFRETAVAPDDGTPPSPAIRTVKAAPEPSTSPTFSPARVSKTRLGVKGTRLEPGDAPNEVGKGKAIELTITAPATATYDFILRIFTPLSSMFIMPKAVCRVNMRQLFTSHFCQFGPVRKMCQRENALI